MSKKVRIRKPGTTLSMRIAKSHDTSKQMNGWIGANGYKFAIALSVIGTTIGLNLGFISHFSNVPAWEILIVGIPFAAILSTLIELTALSSIKRAKAIGVTRANFKLLWPQYMAVGVGVSLSSVSGDQMYSLAFTGNDAWKAWMFACVVSFCLIMTEIYAKEHEIGIEESVRRSGVTKIAQEEEISEHLEKIEREQRLELLQEPEFAQEIREGQRLWLNQLSSARRTEMIQRVQIVESDVTHVQQLPAPQDVKLLPAHVSHSDEHKLELALDALHQTPEITDQELQTVLGTKTPASARFWRLKANEVMGQNVDVHPDKNLTEIVMVEEEHPDVTSLISLPLMLATSEQHTDPLPEIKLDEKSVKLDEPENVQNVKFSRSNEPDDTQDDLTLEMDETVEGEPTENLTHTTDPLPVVELPESVRETVKVRKPKTVKAPAQNPTSGNARKIKAAQAKLVKQGVKPTKTAIAQLTGLSRTTVTEHFKKMAIAEEV